MMTKSASAEKPLDKMTVKDLREVAKDLPEITGVHGMNKAELLTAIKEARGIEDAVEKPKPAASAPKATREKPVLTVQDIKIRMKAVAIQEQEAVAAGDLKMAHIFKQRRHRLKKQTRRIK